MSALAPAPRAFDRFNAELNRPTQQSDGHETASKRHLYAAALRAPSAHDDERTSEENQAEQGAEDLHSQSIHQTRHVSSATRIVSDVSRLSTTAP